MYLSQSESVALANELASKDFDTDELRVALFPNTLATTDVQEILKDSPFEIGAQNVAWVSRGAYTGATSADMFKDIGAAYALVGHSERRYVFGETNDDIRKKFVACLDCGLTPVLCIGDTKEDVEQGKQEYRIEKQLMKALEGVDLDGKKFVVAYEPVWAISKDGSGHPCDPDKAATMHSFIKEQVKKYTESEVPVLYGGSVNEENIASYMEMSTINGVLAGSASTKVDSIVSMLHTIAATR